MAKLVGKGVLALTHVGSEEKVCMRSVELVMSNRLTKPPSEICSGPL